MSIRNPLALAIALLPVLASWPAAADPGTAPQVEIRTRFVEVNAELLAGLGVAVNPVDAQYRSTGAQDPADTSRTGTSGSGGGGLNLMAVLYPDGKGPLGAGPAAIGFGAQAEGFYASQERLFRLIRHHPPDGPKDVKSDSDLDWAVDLVATMRIPFARVPCADEDEDEDDDYAREAVLSLQPIVGATFTHREISLRSDQTFFGGELLRASESKTAAGVVAGVGVTAEIPLLKDIPVLAGLFYKARHVPGDRVEVDSTFGFTESVDVDSAWQHSVSLMIMVPITLVSDPFTSD